MRLQGNRALALLVLVLLACCGCSKAAGSGAAASAASTAGQTAPAVSTSTGVAFTNPVPQAPTPTATSSAAKTPASTTTAGRKCDPGLTSPLAKRAFIDLITPYARAAGQQYKVPAGAIIAIAVQESGFGTTKLALRQCNLFALTTVQAIDVTANGTYMDDDVYASYRTWRASVFDFAHVVATNPDYRSTRFFQQDSALFAQAYFMVASVDPHVYDQVLAIMKKYRLQ